MKRFTKLAVMVALVSTATPALAQDFATLGVEAVVVEDGTMIGSAEMAWRKGDLSGFSFVDVSDGELEYITTHQVNFDVPGADGFFVAAEVGSSTFGESAKLGAGYATDDIPGMQFVSTTVFPIAEGSDSEQISTAWRTKDIEVGEINLYSDGFYDLKFSSPDYGEPRIMLSHDSLPNFAIGAEFQVFGKSVTPSAVVRWQTDF